TNGDRRRDEPIVVFDKVRKTYGDLVVLDDLDFEVAENEKVAIIGPSGSGKTAILRVLMTLVQPTGGVVYVDGEPLWHEEKSGRPVTGSEKHHGRVRSRIGTVYQDSTRFPTMSALRTATEAP